MSTAATVSAQSSVTSTGAVRSNPDGAAGQSRNKPRPLKLVEQSDGAKFRQTGFSLSQASEPMSAEEVLELMQTVCSGVKGGQYNSQLATEIFRLYQQLKLSGQNLEQTHKNEMNRVFIALRQACCRDSGQLGTPCRLKIMELVELRAMCWRPNLAHSQYYLNRPISNENAGSNSQSAAGNQMTNQHSEMSTSAMGNYGGMMNSGNVGGGQMNNMGEFENGASLMSAPAPISAPPFGSVPINPFAFAGPPPNPNALAATQMAAAAAANNHHLQQHMAQFPIESQPGLIPHQTPTSTTAAPSYYLIPASGALFSHAGMHQMAMMPPPASPLGPPNLSAFGMASQGGMTHFTQSQLASIVSNSSGQSTSPNSTAASLGSNGTETAWPKGAVTKPSGKFGRPQKVPGKNQFRDEIIIRNADSGKIMGVKGRRVAVVEEISKTIISFQKVAQGTKERTLTITGNTEETIDHAKLLIEETIRRNVSPNRPEGEINEEDMPVRLEDEEGGEEVGGLSLSDINSNFTSLIEGGLLKLSCEDPEVLQAAQEALNEYFTRLGPLRRSQGAVNTAGMGKSERELRRERRKSMPSFSPDAVGKAQATPRTPTKRMTGAADADFDWRQKRGSSQERGGKRSVDDERATTESPVDQSAGLRRRSSSGQNAASILAKSTPNLSADAKLEGPPAPVKAEMRVVYTKDYLLKCASDPEPQLSSEHKSWITSETPEILRPVPGKINAAEYKERAAALKQSLAATQVA